MPTNTPTVSWEDVQEVSPVSSTAPSLNDVSWADVQEIEPSQMTGAAAQKTPQGAPVSAAPPKYSTFHNVVAGATAPVIAGINLGLKGTDEVGQQLAKLHDDLFSGHQTYPPAPQVPQMKYDPGIAHTTGNIASLIGTQFIPGLDVTADIGKGAEASGMVGKIGSNIPSMVQRAGKGAGLAYVTTPGTAKQRGVSAAMGGALIGGGSVLGKMIKIPKAIRQRVAKSITSKAINPLKDFVHNSLDNRLANITPKDTLGTAYENAKKAANWDGLKPLAQKADQSLSTPVYADSEKNISLPPDLQNEWNNLQNEWDLTPNEDQGKLLNKQRDLYRKARQKYNILPPQFIERAITGGKNEDVPVNGFSPLSYINKAQGLLHAAHEEEKADTATFKGLTAKIQEKINKAPTSFEEAIAQRKAINRMPSSWGKEANDVKVSRTRAYARLLGRALDESVNEQASTPQAQDFSNEWQNQRRNYGHLQQFYNNLNKNSDFDPQLKTALERGNYQQALQQYLPNVNETEPVKIAALQNLIDNPKDAQNVILKQSLNKYITPDGKIDGIKLGQAINQGKISQTLLPLLTHDEKVGLGNLVHSNSIAKSIKKSPGVIHQIAKHPWMSGALMTLVGHHLGVPLELSPASFISGATLPKSIENALARHYENHANELVKSGRLDRLKELSDIFDERGTPREHELPPSSFQQIMPKVLSGTALTPGATMTQY